MKKRLFLVPVSTLALALVGAGAFLTAHLPAARAQSKNPLVWQRPVVIKRVSKPGRVAARPRPKKETVSLLTLQWNLLERGNGNIKEPADPNVVFRSGDQLKLAVTANQNGYLYIINQPEGQDGVVVFPDPRINYGRNDVKKDEEYIIPSFCPELEDPDDCWWKMVPPAGTENFLVIFSRDKITTLPNEVTTPGESVKQSVVAELTAKSRQQVRQETGQFPIPGRSAVRFSTRVQNTNKDDNEELIATIALKHAG